VGVERGVTRSVPRLERTEPFAHPAASLGIRSEVQGAAFGARGCSGLPASGGPGKAVDVRVEPNRDEVQVAARLLIDGPVRICALRKDSV
jgi:hypothetical protein